MASRHDRPFVAFRHSGVKAAFNDWWPKAQEYLRAQPKYKNARLPADNDQGYIEAVIPLVPQLPCVGCGVRWLWVVKPPHRMWLSPVMRKEDRWEYALCDDCHDEWVAGRDIPGWGETNEGGEEDGVDEEVRDDT